MFNCRHNTFVLVPVPAGASAAKTQATRIALTSPILMNLSIYFFLLDRGKLTKY